VSGHGLSGSKDVVLVEGENSVFIELTSPKKMGTLKLDSRPSYARIFLSPLGGGEPNDTLMLTPQEIQLEAGVYDLKIEIIGRKPFMQRIEIKENETLTLEPLLEEVAEEFELSIACTSDPQGSGFFLYIDSKFSGFTTPVLLGSPETLKTLRDHGITLTPGVEAVFEIVHKTWSGKVAKLVEKGLNYVHIPLTAVKKESVVQEKPATAQLPMPADWPFTLEGIELLEKTKLTGGQPVLPASQRAPEAPSITEVSSWWSAPSTLTTVTKKTKND